MPKLPDPNPKITFNKIKHTALWYINKAAVEKLNNDYLEYKYVSFYISEDEKYIKIIIKTFFEDNDARCHCDKKRLKISSSCGNLISKFLLTDKSQFNLIHDILLSNKDQTIFYITLFNKPLSLKQFDLIKWNKPFFNTKNKQDDLLTFNIMTNGAYRLLFSLKYKSMLKNKTSVYFYIDKNTNKVCFCFDHELGYGDSLYCLNDTTTFIYISLKIVFNIFAKYGFTDIDYINEHKKFYFKISPHPTLDEHFIIDNIYTELSCSINNDCD